MLKHHQAIGAWTMECAYTEAKVKLSRIGTNASYAGVPNNTYAILQLKNPPDTYAAFNEEGKGNFFECYATILTIRQELKLIRQLLYHIILTDPETKDAAEEALALGRRPYQVPPHTIPIITMVVDRRPCVGDTV